MPVVAAARVALFLGEALGTGELFAGAVLAGTFVAGAFVAREFAWDAFVVGAFVTGALFRGALATDVAVSAFGRSTGTAGGGAAVAVEEPEWTALAVSSATFPPLDVRTPGESRSGSI